MGRPTKTGIDYFPHLVSHGETMFIVEQRFGNDGYSTWFKILETLGTKETHFINCSNGQSSWEYLQAKTHLTSERLKEILDLLAKLGAIDKDLWVKENVIWSQHFVENLREVYRKRKKEVPSKPSFCRENTIGAGVSVAEGTQSIVEYSKGEKEKNIYRDYVHLTNEEHERLVSEFGEQDVEWMIQTLDNYIGANPKKRNKYTDHNRVLRGWVQEKLMEMKRKDNPDDWKARFLKND